jgi:hypothetical protein
MDHNGLSLLPNYIFLMPITLFLTIGAIVIVALFIRLKKRRLESKEFLAAIEKGVEVKFPQRNEDRLLPGLIWTFVGIIIAIALAAMSPDHVPSGAWIWGLVPVAVGVSYLIVHHIEGKKSDESLR